MRAKKTTQKTSSNFSRALSILKKYDKFGSKPGLSRMKKLCAALGNPQNNFRTILVAGTNGKGSTTAMIASSLHAAGYKTGAYYSPHIIDICERIAVNGRNISEGDFGNCVIAAENAARSIAKSDTPTFFEILTAAALHHFSSCGVDFAVLEIGMGGRLDATNICDAELSCITSIGLDHTKYLGNTTSLIAREKAGIAKKGKPLVVGEADSAAIGTISSEAKKLGAKLAIPSASDMALARRIKLRLNGPYQTDNAEVAICALRHLRIAKAHISRGLSRATIPARLQKISSSPTVIFDSAHNPAAAAALSRALPHLARKHTSRVLLFSSMADKDYLSSLAFLAPHFSHAVVFSPPLSRAEKPATLLHAADISGNWEVRAVKSPREALSLAKKLAGKKGLVLACGSMYSFQFLLGKPALPLSQ